MDFLKTHLSSVGKDVHRLGLATTYGLPIKDLEAALDRGVNYLLWGRHQRGTVKAYKAALKARRESLVLATGPVMGFFGGGVKRGCEAVLKELDLDYIDVFQLFWVGVGAALTDGTLDALQELRAEGKVRAIAISIHDRERAGRLAADSPLDVLMIRYNAAHPGAERDIFPHLAEGKQIVSYTATRWGKLLKRPRGWDGPVPTAGDCYRFALTSPHVSVCLSGPATLAQLDENLAALKKGPLSDEEMAWMREFGKVVHG